MLDDDIINQIIEREKKRKDSGWQPQPLYKELELPRDIPQQKEKSPSKPLEIDIWGPPPDENGLTVIQTSSYFSFSNYQ